MRVLFWVPYPTEGASNRYRVEQYLPSLNKAGIEYSLRPFWNKSAFEILYKLGHHLEKVFYFILGTISRLLDLVRISRFDIVFIHREAYPIGGAFFETILKMLRKSYIFDFDDAIFLPTSSRTNYFIEKYKKPDRMANIIKMSRYVIAGNQYLANFALRYNRSVAVIPTPIDTDMYHSVEEKPGAKIVIGWIGSVTTVGFLDTIRNVFTNLSKRFHNIQFKIVGGNFSPSGLSNITSKPWSLKEDIEDLTSFDIGIMPMPNNEWTKGKCGFKAILYMSMGIPCVCSPVGVNKEIIKDGENGFLADTEKEWTEKLSLLITNPDLRKKLGLEGRKTIEERFSLRVNVPLFLEVIQGIHKGLR